jgi:hypothetical protein
MTVKQEKLWAVSFRLQAYYICILKHSSTIRRFFAAIFLLLFSFCVTPKRFLHDLLANHKDAQTSASLPYEQVAASGFHCHIEDLVVVAPFLPGFQTSIPPVLTSSPLSFSEPLSYFVFSYLSHHDGRGPPVVFCS